MRKLKNGKTWGTWRLAADTNHLVLQKNGRDRYSIPLHEINRSAPMLNWVFQLRLKKWVTNDIIGDLVSAFQDIFHPQQTLCGEGRDQHLDTTAYLAEVIAK